MPPVLAIAVVMIGLGGLIPGVRAAQRHFSWEPELSRKSVHVLMGLVCCTFPWLFRDAWAVWLLAGGAVLALGAVRCVPRLSSEFGTVLSGVERESWGELLFPLAVAFVFWLANGNALLFCVPVLILSLADAMAALVGRRYGAARYRTDDGWKSLEGSTAFFVLAFISTAIPLVEFSNVDWSRGLAIATVMGLILVLIEAIAWQGLDNLFIPVVSFVCLSRMLNLGLEQLGIRLGVLLAVILGFFNWHKSTRLTQSAAIGAALILYVSWAVGGWRWMIAPLVTAVGYTYLCRRPAANPHQHTVHAIASIGGPGLGWLCLAEVKGSPHAVYAFGIAYAANLGMIAVPGLASPDGNRNRLQVVIKATLLGFVFMACPYLLAWWNQSSALALSVGAAIIVAAAVVVFTLWQPRAAESPITAGRWLRQAVISSAASAAGFELILHLKP